MEKMIKRSLNLDKQLKPSKKDDGKQIICVNKKLKKQSKEIAWNVTTNKVIFVS